MGGATEELTIYGHALAALLHLAFAIHLVRLGRRKPEPGPGPRLFIAAILASAAWALAALADPFSQTQTAAHVAALADLARYALWFAFVLTLLRPALSDASARAPRLLLPAAVLVLAAAAATMVHRFIADSSAAETSRLQLAVAMSLPLFGLVLVEQLFRNLAEDSRWNAKPVCLGLGLVFAFDLYTSSEALLFGRFDPDAQAIRGGVHTLAIPLLLVATRRHADWIRRLEVSRSAAFHSATLLLGGGYLLFMSAVGYYVRFFGGEWGNALQLGLAAAGLAFLIALALSGSLRAWIRVFVGKHFFSYRYDYREEWLRFTNMLSTRGSAQEVGGLVIRGLADMVESPGGSLWTRAGAQASYRQVANWNAPAIAAQENPGSELASFLLETGWVINIDEYRNSPRRYEKLAMPAWMLGSENIWLVIPLLAGDDLLGFVTLARPRTSMDLDWEVRDLLKTAGRQAAGFLAQMQATEALLEARKFDAFNRMSAFVVHDLKNIVTQLALMLKNAERHHGNPEFQQDMLLTVQSSLEKMRRLMLQLREGATPPGGARGVELAPILQRLAAMASSRGRNIEVDCDSGLATRGHDDRLERVLGHLVDNALDATPESGRVWVGVARYSGQVRVEVGDNGAGMSEDFVRTQLFRPFSSTKHTGMGIGSYESAQYIQELGGIIAVDSALGRGTVISLTLPLFEASAHSDLHLSTPA
ncbi:MAG: PEP-CTERM system histidine kinase PrsK [Rubrivivax sp.]|nr:PEP-CTERM system histidine kinase PrsK [Rubrivivax sp.]